MMLLALVTATAAQTAASLAPEQIFARAQQAWQERVIPPYESFRVSCQQTFLASSCQNGDVVQFIVRTSDGRTFAQRVPAAGGAPTVLMQGGYITGPVGTPLGFYRAITDNGASPMPSPPPNLAPDPLSTIATVTAKGHVYDVALAGEERIDGRPCYHLTFHPEIAPDRYPLRDVWVDESTFEVVQLTYERPYDEEHTHAIVRYRFAPVGVQQIWTIVSIEAQASIHGFLSTKLERVADDLSEITFPASAPDWYFTPPGC